MNESNPDEQTDPLLLPFLQATGERDAKRHLEELIARAAPRIAVITRSSRTPEDAFQEATYRVVKHLRQLRDERHANGIANYLHYVQVVASRVVKDQVRQEHPKRRSMVDALRHVLAIHPSLDAWESEGRKICGLAGWRGENTIVTQSERLTRLLDEPRTFQDAVDMDCDAWKLSHATLVARLLEWIGHPIRFDQLAKIVCGLRRIEDLAPVAGEQAGRSLSEWLPDRGRRPDEEMQWREFLGRLWQEIEQLPRLHRLAYLLNFTAADGQLELFSAYGIADMRRISAVLQITEDELAPISHLLPSNGEAPHQDPLAFLWRHLPLSDAVIAIMLGIERQKVINLRKAAGDRLSRLMIRAHLRTAVEQRNPGEEQRVNGPTLLPRSAWQDSVRDAWNRPDRWLLTIAS